MEGPAPLTPQMLMEHLPCAGSLVPDPVDWIVHCWSPQVIPPESCVHDQVRRIPQVSGGQTENGWSCIAVGSLKPLLLHGCVPSQLPSWQTRPKPREVGMASRPRDPGCLPFSSSGPASAPLTLSCPGRRALSKMGRLTVGLCCLTYSSLVTCFFHTVLSTMVCSSRRKYSAVYSKADDM